jgi:hypothetical protein
MSDVDLDENPFDIFDDDDEMAIVHEAMMFVDKLRVCVDRKLNLQTLSRNFFPMKRHIKKYNKLPGSKRLYPKTGHASHLILLHTIVAVNKELIDDHIKLIAYIEEYVEFRLETLRGKKPSLLQRKEIQKLLKSMKVVEYNKQYLL